MAEVSKVSITRRAGLGLLATPFLTQAQTTSGDITIGALLSITGDWSTLGITSRALLQTAVSEINTFLTSVGVSTRVRLQVEDTKLDATACVNSFRVLTGAGASIIIGPQSSSEAAAVLPLLAGANAACISQGSTAGTLSLPNDNLYRFVPDDSLEAQAMVALAQAKGIKTIVPVWRGDAGNRGLAAAMRRLFPAAGGTITAGMEYAADSPDMAATARALAAELQGVIGPHTAVYLSGFDEVAQLFRAAGSFPVLSTVPWLGSDGVALSVPLASDSVAAAFAIRTGYANPTLLRSDAARAKWAPLVKAVTASTGIEPDAFALAAYDACWCAMQARLMSGSSSLAAWKAYLPQVAENFFGASGWCRLNANGDRAFGDFEFWALQNLGAGPVWAPVATYENQILSMTSARAGRPGRIR